MSNDRVDELEARVEQLEDGVQPPGVRTTRRGALVLSGVAALSLLGGSTGIVAANHAGQDDFHGTAVLVGTEAQRPAAGGPFFDDKTEYHYIYIATDTGGRFVIETGDAAWLDISPVVGSDILLNPVTVVNDATEVFVYTADIEADELRTDEQHRVRLHGRYSTASTSQTFQLRFYINGTEVNSTTSATGIASDSPIRTTFVFTVQETGVNGTVQPYIEATFRNVNNDARAAAQAIDTTETLQIRASIQWGTADPDNEVIIEQGSHELIS